MAQSLKTDQGCPTCGATTPLNPEDVVIACKYCGTIYTIGRQKIGDHKFFPPKYSMKEAETKIYEFIKSKSRLRGMSSYGGVTIRKVLVPYWIISSKSESHYRGYKKSTRQEDTGRRDKNGNRITRTVTVYEPVESTIKENRLDPLICRMGTLIFGISVLNKIVKKAIQEKELIEFNQEQLLDDPENIDFLSGEIKSQEAKEMVETMIQDDHRKRARANTTELFDCRTMIQINNMIFLHYPIFQAEYKFGKETYRILMDGHTGKVLDAEIPITTRLRIISFTTAVLTLLTVFGLGIYLRPTIDASGNQGELIYGVVSIILGLIGYKANATAWSITSRGN